MSDALKVRMLLAALHVALRDSCGECGDCLACLVLEQVERDG